MASFNAKRRRKFSVRTQFLGGRIKIVTPGIKRFRAPRPKPAQVNQYNKSI